MDKALSNLAWSQSWPCFKLETSKGLFQPELSYKSEKSKVLLGQLQLMTKSSCQQNHLNLKKKSFVVKKHFNIILTTVPQEIHTNYVSHLVVFPHRPIFKSCCLTISLWQQHKDALCRTVIQQTTSSFTIW